MGSSPAKEFRQTFSGSRRLAFTFEASIHNAPKK